MMRRVLVPALALSVVTSTAMGAPERIDIVTIYEQFLAAGVATKHCNTLDNANRPNWLKNYQVVAIRSAMALKERNPNVSDVDLISKVKAASERTTAKVDAEANTNGCTSPLIEQLLKLYRIQAGLNFN